MKLSRPGMFVLAIAVIAGAVLGAGAPIPASAATPSVEYSRDGGLTWSVSPPSYLFSSALRLVPGDVATETMIIRLLRSEPTLVQVSLTNVWVGDALLDSAMTIEGADAAGAGLQATRLSALTDCQPLVPDRVLSRGQTVSVSLTLRASTDLAGSRAQDAASRFDVALALSDPGPSTAPNGCAVAPAIIPGTGTGSAPATGNQGAGAAGLAYTGSALAYPAFITAALTLGIGWLFVMVGRRRRQNRE